jgi:hypothetical protein
MVAGMKMRDNNPGIADLSDPNRPEKIAEQFREIYNNAWRMTRFRITFIRYAHNQKIGMPNNLNVLRSKKTKGHKQDSQDRLRSYINKKAKFV